MKVFLFPGQGAQRKGMGKDLFNEFPELTEKADEILGYSIRELCLQDPDNLLGQTQFTQPVIYVVNGLKYLSKIKSEPEPDYVMGHSVGEYSALYVARVLDFETGLRLVKKRGELMSQAHGGGMAAVLGLNEANVRAILENSQIRDLTIANLNSPHQLVISGPKAAIEQIEPEFLEGGASHYNVLNVSGAFHTRFMADAQELFREFARDLRFGEMNIPVISNVTARPYQQHQLKELLFDQITSPVKWSESIRYLLAKGTEVNDFIEVGGSGVSVVKALATRTANEAGPLDPAIIEAEEKALAKEVRQRESTMDEAWEQKTSLPGATPFFVAETLGSQDFKKEFNLKYAYLAGGMSHGIASREMVSRMARARCLAFYGTMGSSLARIEEDIRYLQQTLDPDSYGMNFSASLDQSEHNEQMMDLFIRYGITLIEAASFIQMTPALVHYRAIGLTRNAVGDVQAANRIIAKVSRLEIASLFLAPAPQRIIHGLLTSQQITRQQAELLKEVPMADALTVAADSGWRTENRMPYAVVPAILRLRDEMRQSFGYGKKVHVGASGGIGTAEAAAASFILGADYILTGSINQCTVEAGTSETVKDMLQDVNVQDTDYAPAGDAFELGTRVQVLKRGVFFPARAKKLYDLYRHHGSLDEIDEKTATQIQKLYFKRSFREVFQEFRERYPAEVIEKAEQAPKLKMALVFRWYFTYATSLALEGSCESNVDYQVHTGPALGAFNQWVKGTELENWRNRHVDQIAEKVMTGAADILNLRFGSMAQSN